MRVLQVIETGGPGGAETVLARLASGLARRGHLVHCVVANGSWLPAELEKRQVSVALFPQGGKALDCSMLSFLREQMRSHQADVVHAHLFDGSLYAGLAARLEGVPCVTTLHGQVDVPRSGAKSAIKRAFFRRLVSRVVAVSETLRSQLKTALALHATDFVVIANGVPLPPWAPPERGDGAPPRLIAIGNIRRPKDYPTLLSALARLREEMPNVQLDIVGQPDRDGLYETLQTQVGALGLSDAVTFHGFVSDPAKLLAAADCFVLASSEEGFSLATIEAMLAGVPVVATRSGGPQEILRDGETGVLVPVRDPEVLAAGLARVLSGDRHEIGRMVAAARLDAERRYSEEAMVQRYEQLYREVVR